MRFLTVLMDEHRGFSTMLDVLDAIAGRLERGEPVPMPMLVDVLDFFENFTDRHHDKEEEMLFPLLAKHGIGPDQTVVSALMFQHEAGRVYGSKMRSELNRLQAGGRRRPAPRWPPTPAATPNSSANTSGSKTTTSTSSRTRC